MQQAALWIWAYLAQTWWKGGGGTQRRRKKKHSGRRPVDGPETWDFPAEANAKCRFGWVCFSWRQEKLQPKSDKLIPYGDPATFIHKQNDLRMSFMSEWVCVYESVGGVGVGGSGGRFFSPWNMTVVWRHDWPMSCTGEKILPHWLPFSWSWMFKQPLNTQERSLSLTVSYRTYSFQREKKSQTISREQILIRLGVGSFNLGQ